MSHHLLVALNLAQDDGKDDAWTIPIVGPIGTWVTSNLLPLALLALGVLFLVQASKGQNAAIMRRLAAVVIMLGIVGIALLPALGVDLGKWMWGLLGVDI